MPSFAQLEARVTLDDRELQEGLRRDERLLQEAARAAERVSRTVGSSLSAAFRGFREGAAGAARDAERSLARLGAARPVLDASGLTAPLESARQAALRTRRTLEAALTRLAPSVDTAAARGSLLAVADTARRAAREVDAAFTAARPRLRTDLLESAVRRVPEEARQAAAQAAQALAGVRLTLNLGAARAELSRLADLARRAGGEVTAGFAALRPDLDLSRVTVRFRALAAEARQALAGVGAAFRQRFPALDLTAALSAFRGLPEAARDSLFRAAGFFARFRPTFELSALLAPLRGLPGVARESVAATLRAFTGARPSLDTSRVTRALAAAGTAAREAGAAAGQAFAGLSLRFDARPALQALGAVASASERTRSTLTAALGGLRAALDTQPIQRALSSVQRQAASVAAGVRQAFTGLAPRIDLGQVTSAVARFGRQATDAGRDASRALSRVRAVVETREAVLSLRRLHDGAGRVARAVVAAFAGLRLQVETAPARRELTSLAESATTTARLLTARLASVRPTLALGPLERALGRLPALAGTAATGIRQAFGTLRPTVDLTLLRQAFATITRQAAQVGAAVAGAFAGARGGVDTGGGAQALAQMATAARRAAVAVRGLFAGLALRVDVAGPLSSLRALSLAAGDAGRRLRASLADFAPRVDTRPAQDALRTLAVQATETGRRAAQAVADLRPRLDVRPVLASLTQIPRAASDAAGQARQAFAGARLSLGVEGVLGRLNTLGGVARQAAGQVASAFRAVVPRLDASAALGSLRQIQEGAARAARAVAGAFTGLGGGADTRGAGTALAALGAQARQAATALGNLFARIRPRLDVAGPLQALAALQARARDVAGAVQARFAGLSLSFDTAPFLRGVATVESRLRSLRAVITASLAGVRPGLDTTLIHRALGGVEDAARRASAGLVAAFARARAALGAGLGGAPTFDFSRLTEGLAALPAVARQAAQGVGQALARARPTLNTAAATDALLALSATSAEAAGGIGDAFRRLALGLDTAPALAALTGITALAPRVVAGLRQAFGQVRLTLDARGALGALQAVQALGRRATEALSARFAALRPMLDVGGVTRPLASLVRQAVVTAGQVRQAVGSLRPAVRAEAAGAALRGLAETARRSAQGVGTAFAGLRLTLDTRAPLAALEGFRTRATTAAREVTEALTRARAALQGGLGGRVAGLDLTPITQALAQLPQRAREAGQALGAALGRLRPEIVTTGAQRALQGLQAAGQAAARAVTDSWRRARLAVDASGVTRTLGGLGALAARAASSVTAAFRRTRPQLDTSGFDAGMAKLVAAGLKSGLQAGAGLSGGMRRAVQQVERDLGNLSNRARQTGSDLSDALGGGLLAGFGAAISANVTGPVVALAKESTNTALKLEGITAILEQTEGSSGAAQASFNRLREMAERLGASFIGTAEAYQQFRSAGAQPLLATRLLEGLLRAGAASRASIEDVSGAALQLSQILSSGKFQGDELRIINERIKGFARVVKEEIGTLDTEAIIKSGIPIEQVMSRIADGLLKIQPPLNTGSVALNRFKNELEQFRGDLGRGFLTGLQALLPDVTAQLKTLRANFGELSPPMQQFISLASSLAAVLLPLPAIVLGLRAAWAALAPAITAGGLALLGISLPAGVVIAAFAAITTAVAVAAAAYASNLGGFRDDTNRVFGQMREDFQQFFGGIGQLTRGAVETLKGQWLQGAQEIRAGWDRMLSGLSLATITASLAALVIVIPRVVAAVGTLAAAFAALYASVGLVGIAIGGLATVAAAAAVAYATNLGGFREATDRVFSAIEEGAGRVFEGIRTSSRGVIATLKGDWLAGAREIKAGWHEIMQGLGREAVPELSPELQQRLQRFRERLMDATLDVESSAGVSKFLEKGLGLDEARKRVAAVAQEARKALLSAADEDANRIRDAYARAVVDVRKELAMLRAPDMVARIKAEFEGKISDAQARELARITTLRDREKEAIDRTKQAVDSLRQSLSSLGEDILKEAGRLPTASLRRGATQFGQQLQGQAQALPRDFFSRGGRVQSFDADRLMGEQFNIQSRAIATLGTRFGELGCARAVSAILSGSVTALAGLNEASVQGLVRKLIGYGAQAVSAKDARPGDVAVFNKPRRHVGVVAEREGQLGVVHNATSAGYRTAFDKGMLGSASFLLRLPQVAQAGQAAITSLGAATAGLTSPAEAAARTYLTLAQGVNEMHQKALLAAATSSAARVAIEHMGVATTAAHPGVQQMARAFAFWEQVLKRAEMARTVREIGTEARQQFLIASAATDAQRLALEKLGVSLHALPQAWQAAIERSAEYLRQARGIEAATEAQRELLQATARTEEGRVAIELFGRTFGELSQTVQESVTRVVRFKEATARWEEVRDAAERLRTMRLEIGELAAATDLERAAIGLLNRPLTQFNAEMRAAAEATRQGAEGGVRFGRVGEFIARVLQMPWLAGVAEAATNLGRATGRLGQEAAGSHPRLGALADAANKLTAALAAGDEATLRGILQSAAPLIERIKGSAEAASPAVQAFLAMFAQAGQALEGAGGLRSRAMTELFVRLGESAAQSARDVAQHARELAVEERAAEVTAQAMFHLNAEFIGFGGSVDEGVAAAHRMDAQLQALRRTAALNAVAIANQSDSWEAFVKKVTGQAFDLKGTLEAAAAIGFGMRAAGNQLRGEDDADDTQRRADAKRRLADITHSLNLSILGSADAMTRAREGAGTFARGLEQLGYQAGEVTGKVGDLAKKATDDLFRAELLTRVRQAREGMEAATGSASRHVQVLREMGYEFARLTAEEQRFAIEEVNEILKLDKIREFAEGTRQIFSQAFDDLFNRGFKGFFDSVVRGFQQMLQQMAAEYLSSQLTALLIKGLGSAFGGDFGKLLGGLAGAVTKRASGGPLDVGKPYLVHQDELIVPKRAGHVFNPQQMAAAMAGPSGPVTVNIHVHDVRDAQSFVRSKNQIAAMVGRDLARETRRNG